LRTITKHLKRFKHAKRGLSNVIVVMLSLVILVVISANVILWSYQMNQLDWEKMQENISIINVEGVNRSSWFTTQSEYVVNTGSQINGTYEGTQVIDDNRWETFREGQPPIAPTTVGTSTSSSATQYPYQLKAFYANGLFWVFYSDGTNLVYRTSSDGSTWSATTIARASNYGYYFSIWFDGTYVHYACARGSTGEALFYRRGTPNTDGTITWSTTEQQAAEVVSSVTYYQRQTRAEGKLWVLDSSYLATANYTTEIVTGTTAAGNYYYINPFTNHTASNGTTLPSNILLQGWRTATPVTLRESGYVVYGYVKNRVASSHAGRVYARLWKSQYSNMSNAVALSDWGYYSVSFTATAGQEIAFSIPFSVANPPNDEYLYVEFAWYISTASASPAAGLYLRAENSSSYVRQTGWAYFYPYVSVDSSGYPFIAYRFYNYYNYPSVTKSSLNNGTWQTASEFPYQLQTSSSGSWRSSALPLTEGKVYVFYNNRYTTYGRLWNGSDWGTEETVTTTDLQASEYFSAVTQGDDVHFAFLGTSPYNIAYKKRIYGIGWGTEVTVQSSTTSSSAPTLSINTANNDLYLFWAGSPAANCIYYKKQNGGIWDANPTTWIVGQATQTLDTGNDLDEAFYGSIWKSQSFKSATSDKLWRVEVYSKRGAGTASVAINVNIYMADDNGKPTGPSLGAGTIASFTSTTYSWRTCTFSTPINVNANTKYCMVLSAPTGSTTQYYHWAVDSTSPPYTDGNFAYSSDSGATWVADATKDALFRALFESTLSSNDRLTSYLKDTGGRIGLVYVTRTASPYSVKHEYLSFTQPLWALDLNGTFKVDISTYPLTCVQTIEIQLRYRASDSGESWYIEAYNWTSMTYSSKGFNITTGNTPTTLWDQYSVNFTNKWKSYIQNDGTIYLKLHDNGRDINQTAVDVDFLGVRVVINGMRFTFQNDGALTSHLIALWVNTATKHQQYDINLLVNSGENTTYTKADTSLPTENFVVKVVTERGNIAVFARY
jgi:hypothetical protein